MLQKDITKLFLFMTVSILVRLVRFQSFGNILLLLKWLTGELLRTKTLCQLVWQIKKIASAWAKMMSSEYSKWKMVLVQKREAEHYKVSKIKCEFNHLTLIVIFFFLTNYLIVENVYCSCCNQLVLTFTAMADPFAEFFT